MKNIKFLWVPPQASSKICLVILLGKWRKYLKIKVGSLQGGLKRMRKIICYLCLR